MKFSNQVSLQTPESVNLNFALAGIGNRAYALIIDYIVWGFILMVFLFASTYLSFQILDLVNGSDRLAQWLWAIQLILFFVVYVGYFVFFETIWQGQTPGKRVAKIRVIRDDGRPARLPQAALRALLRPVDDIFFIGAMLIVFGKREKRLGDFVAGTLVIEERSPTRKSAKFDLNPQAEPLAQRLLEQADLTLLHPQDFDLVREYLQRRGEMLEEARSQLSIDLAYEMKERIAWDLGTEKLGANLFLEALYLAYQQHYFPGRS